jgi:hypothetical protein
MRDESVAAYFMAAVSECEILSVQRYIAPHMPDAPDASVTPDASDAMEGAAAFSGAEVAAWIGHGAYESCL